MSLLSSVHHIATATNDLDRMVSFYRDAFELEPAPGHPMETPVGRIAFYQIGEVQVQIVESGNIGEALADTPAVLLQRDLRLDHVTMHAESAAAFASIRERLIKLGATTGDVQDFRGADLLAYKDPDGHVMEIIFDPARQ